MTTDTKNNTRVLTPTFRVSFPSVFQARKVSDQNAAEEPKFRITMLFKKTDDISTLKAAVKAAGIAKWGPDMNKWPKKLMLPFRDGAEKDFDGYGPDVIFVGASSKQKPAVVDQSVQAIIDPSEFYGGCYARATVNAFTWEFMGKAGISFGLGNIQKVKDGDSFSGKSKPENDFDSIDAPAVGASKAEEASSDPLGL